MNSTTSDLTVNLTIFADGDADIISEIAHLSRYARARKLRAALRAGWDLLYGQAPQEPPRPISTTAPPISALEPYDIPFAGMPDMDPSAFRFVSDP
jgi:hypothetical protein